MQKNKLHDTNIILETFGSNKLKSIGVVELLYYQKCNETPKVYSC